MQRAEPEARELVYAELLSERTLNTVLTDPGCVSHILKILTSGPGSLQERARVAGRIRPVLVSMGMSTCVSHRALFAECVAVLDRKDAGLPTPSNTPPAIVGGKN